jgi:TonB family protein
MRRPLPRLVFTVLTTLTALFFVAQCVLADASVELETPQTGVGLLKLSPPIYPPLARQARITGDVRIQLLIRRDGSVESADVVSGHPMLKQAALESAQRSIFECRNGEKDATPYLLAYTFALRDDDNPCGEEIDNEWHVRSFKCIYLWKCKVLRTFRLRPQPVLKVTQSENHVTVLAPSACVETETSY